MLGAGISLEIDDVNMRTKVLFRHLGLKRKKADGNFCRRLRPFLPQKAMSNIRSVPRCSSLERNSN